MRSHHLQPLLIGVAVLSVIAAAFSIGSTASPPSATDRGVLRPVAASVDDTLGQVRDAATQAVVVHQENGAPRPGRSDATPVLRGRPAAAPSPGTAPSSGEISRRRSEKDQRIGGHFTGAAAAHESAAAHAVAVAETDGTFRDLDAGVSRVAFASPTVSGTHAVVDGTVEAWSSIAQQAPDGSWVTATPSNQLLVHLELDRDKSGRWLVSTFTWTFAPGSQP